MKKLSAIVMAALLCPTVGQSAVEIQTVGGWFESGYVTWTAAATGYHVYVAAAGSDDYTQLDSELIREYPGYVRADALGLRAGEYQFRIVPVEAGQEQTAEAATATFTATAHDRSGFAHVGMTDGIGAYRNDGTLREGAKVLYVWADNAKTVTTKVQTGAAASSVTQVTGLQNIIDNYKNGYDTTPLDIRIIGTIKADDMDKLSSNTEGFQIKGKDVYSNMPITIEGVGDDAAIHGFGILCRNCKGTELRNLAVMYCMDDAVSLDTGNSNVWVHNMDFFYGRPGTDSDQVKGDGTVDVKGQSRNITIAYNHFYDNGKSSLGGMKSETTDCWLTYHHNWFDHSDSRHPRIRTMFFHIYNNYYDGNAKYGVGMTLGGSAFVEQNYFRNCKYPMLDNHQGTDAEGSGTFDDATGGVIKACGNIIVNACKVQYYDGTQTDGKWDAVLVTDRAEAVTATAYTGGSAYNAEADEAARTTYIENKIEDASTVVSTVTGPLGAGRMGHGDFTWTFRNSAQDENYAVIEALTTAVQQYQSTLVGFYGGSRISNGGATERVDDGDGKGLSDAINDAYVPSWASGSSTDAPAGMTPVIGTEDDYFWFNADNAAQVEAWLADGTLTKDDASVLQTTSNVNSSGTVYSDKVGSLQLVKLTGYATFYLPQGIGQVDYYLARTGSLKGTISGSNDGTEYTVIEEYSGTKGVKELSVVTTGYQYVKITNEATGSLHLQGIRIYAPASGSDDDQSIERIGVDDMQTTVYDLQGRRLQTTRPGFNIVGGKLQLIK